MPVETLLMLFFAGLAAGVISALAGGSALITFPALIAAGLPPINANASNFVTVLPANLGAAAAYRSELSDLKPLILKLGIVSLAGGLVGGLLLLQMSNNGFSMLLPWLLLIATLLLAFGDKAKELLAKSGFSTNGHSSGKASNFPSHALIFGISIYGGFFGAGLGILMLASLSIIGLGNYHAANAVKNLLNAGIGLLGVLMFAAFGLISWPHAIVLTIGSAIGGFAAVRVSRKINADLLSKAMVVIGLVLSAYYFWIEYGS